MIKVSEEILKVIKQTRKLMEKNNQGVGRRGSRLLWMGTYREPSLQMCVEVKVRKKLSGPSWRGFYGHTTQVQKFDTMVRACWLPAGTVILSPVRAKGQFQPEGSHQPTIVAFSPTTTTIPLHSNFKSDIVETMGDSQPVIKPNLHIIHESEFLDLGSST